MRIRIRIPSYPGAPIIVPGLSKSRRTRLDHDRKLPQGAVACTSPPPRPGFYRRYCYRDGKQPLMRSRLRTPPAGTSASVFYLPDPAMTYIMAYKFSHRSEKELASVHPDLQQLAREVINFYDFSVRKGHRERADQDLAFETGASKTPWPESKHNKIPAEAFDLAPYLHNKKITQKEYYMFAGFVLGVAAELDIPIRFGGDWDGDREVTDQTFNDLFHFEMKRKLYT